MSPKSDSRLNSTVSTLTSRTPNGATQRHNVYQRREPLALLVEGMRDDGTIVKASNTSLFSLLSFMYAVHDVEGLLQHCKGKPQRQAEWREAVTAETEALREEDGDFGDLLLVDGVDVYRSLPSKLLRCHEWFSHNFEAAHILKTDDDTLVNLRTVVDVLFSAPLQGNQWWGNFRRDWPVERVGKWREEDYSPSVYPTFACGSGYIVSRDLHLWLAANARVLHPFQGEDVSMAIWLSPLAPTLIQDLRWQCFKICQDDMLSMPDLMPAELRLRWHQHLNCSSPCSSC